MSTKNVKRRLLPSFDHSPVSISKKSNTSVSSEFSSIASTSKSSCLMKNGTNSSANKIQSKDKVIKIYSSYKDPLSEKPSSEKVRSQEPKKLAPEKEKLTTIIEKIPVSQHSKYSLKDKSEFDLFYLVFLPYIYDERFNRVKQPLLIKVEKDLLVNSGFVSPFIEIFDHQKNFFAIAIGCHHLTGQIVAIGGKFEQIK